MNENENYTIQTKSSEVLLKTTLYLQKIEMEIKTLMGGTVYGIGCILRRAKKEMENECAVFRKWHIETIGYSVSRVHNLITCAETIDKHGGKLDNLPQELILLISNEKAPKELKEKVLKGEITKVKEYKELKVKFEIAEKELEQTEKENQSLKKTNAKISKDLENMIDVSSKKDLMIEHSENRNLGELHSLFIDINISISEKIPKIKHYLSKLEEVGRNNEIQKATYEINKILLLMR